MTAEPREFGLDIDREACIDRPGSYAVIRRPGDGMLLTVEEKAGRIFLPGGGWDPGETPLAALHRELAEETGYAITNVRPLDVVVQRLITKTTRIAYRKICHVFTADLAGAAPEQPTARHDIIRWLPLPDAIAALDHDAFCWILTTHFGPADR